MPITRVPPGRTRQSGTQISLDVAEAPGRAQAQLGKTIQQAENQLMENAARALNAFGQVDASKDEALAKDLANKGKLEMEQFAVTRSQQIRDDQGNPLFQTLTSDISANNQSVIENIIGGISDPNVRKEVERRLTSHGTSIVLKSVGVQNEQQIDFTRAATLESLDSFRQDAILNDLSDEQIDSHIDQEINSAGGAFSFQEQADIKRKAKQNIALDRANITLNSTDEEAISTLIDSVDSNPNLSTDQRIKIKQNGEARLQELTTVRLKEQEMKEMIRKVEKGESVSAFPQESIDGLAEGMYQQFQEQNGRPPSLSEKARLLLGLKGATVTSFTKELSAALQDPTRGGDAFTAYQILHETNRSLLKNLDAEAVQIATIAQTHLNDQPELSDRGAMDIAHQTTTEIGKEARDEILARFNKDFNKKFKSGKAYSNFVADELGLDVDTISNESAGLHVNNQYMNLLKEYYTKTGNLQRALDATTEALKGDYQVSDLADGRVIANSPEVLFPDVDAGTIKSEIVNQTREALEETGMLIEEADIDPNKIYINSNGLSLLASSPGEAVYLVEVKEGGFYRPLKGANGAPIYIALNIPEMRILQSKVNDSEVTKEIKSNEAREEATRSLLKNAKEDVADPVKEVLDSSGITDIAKDGLGALIESSAATTDAVRDIVDTATDSVLQELEERPKVKSVIAEGFIKATTAEQTIRDAPEKAGEMIDSAVDYLTDKFKKINDRYFNPIKTIIFGPSGENVQEVPEATETNITIDKVLDEEALTIEANLKVVDLNQLQLSPDVRIVDNQTEDVKLDVSKLPDKGEPLPLLISPEESTRSATEVLEQKIIDARNSLIYTDTGKDISHTIMHAQQLSTNTQNRMTEYLHIARTVFPNNETLAQLAALQAMHETGGRISDLARNANNLFGIKGTGDAGSVTMPTYEYVNGVKTRVKAKFRKYSSLHEAFKDYAKLILTKDVYRKVASAQNIDEAIMAIDASPYATDIAYGQKLQKLQMTLLSNSLKQDQIPSINKDSIAKAGITHRRTVKHLLTVNETLAQKSMQIIKILRAQGFQPVIWEGNRTIAEQREKVRKGYSKTMKSRHLHGQAVDIVDNRYRWEQGSSEERKRFWNALGLAVKQVGGLKWGGNFKSFYDPAHVQLR